MRKSKYIKILSICFLCIISADGAFSQHKKSFRLAFYNVENLFDTSDSPQHEDDDYTPLGKNTWTTPRLAGKIKNISRAVSDLSPDILGISESENESTTAALTAEISRLTNKKYKYIHRESGDNRGLDPAFIYDSECFLVISHDTIRSPKNERSSLYIKGVIASTNDTIHVLVHHWTSRYMGQKATEGARKEMARRSTQCIEEIKKLSPDAKIVMMGDFNDGPNDVSIRLLLHLNKDLCCHSIHENSLSYYYDGKWYAFDQIFTNFVPNTVPAVAHKAEYLLNDSHKPFRTYTGNRYIGGYSDHLPVYLDYEVSH